VDGSPAQQAQLMPGDVITAANGAEIAFDSEGTAELREIIQASDSVQLTVNRGSEMIELALIPDLVTDEATGQTARQIGITFRFENYTLGAAIPGAGRLLKDMSGMMLDFLRNLIFRGQGAEDVAGPIGTVAVVSQYLAIDPSQLVYFAVVISLNLGIMNLIPFPGLDGSRLVFLAVEAVRRKPVPPEKEGMVHAAGLVLLLVLSAVLIWHDIVTFII